MTLKIGMDILADEHVRMDALLGHGGFFKTPGTAQQLLAGALNVPVSVMATAARGGPWGMALLAAYRVRREAGETLEAYLKDKVFAGASGITLDPDPADHEGFEGLHAPLHAGAGGRTRRRIPSEISGGRVPRIPKGRTTP